MHALSQGGVEYSELLDFDPNTITDQNIQSLQLFFEIIKQRGCFDPFDLPKLSVDRELHQDVLFQLFQQKLISHMFAQGL
jgi:hypothetical protein